MKLHWNVSRGMNGYHALRERVHNGVLLDSASKDETEDRAFFSAALVDLGDGSFALAVENSGFPESIDVFDALREAREEFYRLLCIFC